MDCKDTNLKTESATPIVLNDNNNNMDNEIS